MKLITLSGRGWQGSTCRPDLRENGITCSPGGGLRTLYVPGLCTDLKLRPQVCQNTYGFQTSSVSKEGATHREGKGYRSKGLITIGLYSKGRAMHTRFNP